MFQSSCDCWGYFSVGLKALAFLWFEYSATLILSFEHLYIFVAWDLVFITFACACEVVRIFGVISVISGLKALSSTC